MPTMQFQANNAYLIDTLMTDYQKRSLIKQHYHPYHMQFLLPSSVNSEKLSKFRGNSIVLHHKDCYATLQQPSKRQIIRHHKHSTLPSKLSYLLQKDTNKIEKQAKDLLSQLPVEIISEIIQHLADDIPSLCQLMSTSHQWYSLLRFNATFWRQLSIHHPIRQRQWQLQIPANISLNHIDWYQLFKQRSILDTRWSNGRVVTHYLMGHLDSIYCLQFDHTRLITGSRDRTIKIWDLRTYRCINTLQGHEGSVLCLKFNQDTLISGSSDSTLIVWKRNQQKQDEKATWTPVMRLYGHTAGVLDVAFNDQYIVSCSKDKTIKVWDSSTGQLLRTMLAHRGPVNAIQLVGDRLVSASGDALIKMWNITTGECLKKYAGHSRGLACVQFDGETIVSGSNDKTIKVWDAASGRCLMNLEGHTDLVRSLALKNDKIVSASYDQSIRVWDRKTGACLLNFQSGHTSWVFDVAFDATKIVSASQDQRVLVMDFTYGLDTRFF